MKITRPDLKFEEEVLKSGYGIVIGVDEVGRGALAGPVVAGAVAVILKGVSFHARKGHPFIKVGVDDSKKLSLRKREELAKVIKKNTVWGIGEAGVGFINKYGIVKATEKAMRGAVKDIRYKIENIKKTNSHRSYFLNFKSYFVLVDAYHVKYIPGVGLKSQKAIVHGDQKSISIAAASIIAKVHRDKLMEKLGRRARFRKYGWGKNKGYGTKDHQEALKKHGASKVHRTLFIRKVTQNSH